jgi:hypothetical protein
MLFCINSISAVIYTAHMVNLQPIQHITDLLMTLLSTYLLIGVACVFQVVLCLKYHPAAFVSVRYFWTINQLMYIEFTLTRLSPLVSPT